MSRMEEYLEAIITGDNDDLPEPRSERERDYYEAAKRGLGGSGGGGEYFETITGGRLYWDGNTDGLPSVMVNLGEEMGGEVAYYKVSDVQPPTYSLLADYSIVVTTFANDSLQSMNLSQMGMIMSTGNGNTFFYVGAAIYKESADVMGTIFPEQGIWLAPAFAGGRLILEFGYPYCEFESKQLKPEHLPNNDFIVTLTVNEDMTMTTDKTISDIDQAIVAGKNIIVKAYMLDGTHRAFRDYAYYPEIQLTVSYFESMSDNVVSFHRLSINSNNTVDYESTTL